MSIDYMARETVGNLRRNLLMTAASVLCVAVSLTMVGGALLLKQGVATATIEWQGNIGLQIYMRPDASPGESAAVERQLSQMRDVKSFRYVNQQQAYKEFKKLFAAQPTLVNSVQASDLPPSYRIVPVQASDAADIGAQFEDYPGVKQVALAKQTIDTLLRLTGLAQKVMFGIAVALLIAALALILNTIRMAIFARRREISVMKLVGATNWFIRVPFMLEGMFQGLVGAGVAFGIVYGLRDLISWAVRHYGLQLVSSSWIVSLGDVVGTGLFVLAVGAVVGTLGSAMAVRSFLDV